DDRAHAVARFDAARGARQRYEGEFRIVRSDGEIRYLQSRGATVVDAGGRAVRMHGAVQDVTERKRDDDRLQALLDVLQLSIDALPVHVAVLDGDGTIVEVNAAWR